MRRQENDALGKRALTVDANGGSKEPERETEYGRMTENHSPAVPLDALGPTKEHVRLYRRY